MGRVMRSLYVLFICLVFNACNLAYADTSTDSADRDIARQLQEVQSQLRNMREEMRRFSERLEKIEALLPPPRQPEKLTVNLGGAPMFGDPKAEIAIVEFSDYQCPYCRRFHLETFPHLQKVYIDPGKAVFAIKNFPLSFHPLAMDAALAVNCVRQQSIKAFWDIQEQLFSHQDRLGSGFYNDLVKRYALDQKKFSTCLDDTKQKDAIVEDIKYAHSLGVEGTPTFFIGRLEGDQLVDAVRLVGAQPYRAFTQILDSFNKANGAEKLQ